MDGLTVLIVDDEQPARKKLRAYLQNEDGIAAVFEADNGVNAVELIREKNPHLVLLDIQMPGMNGFEVIEAVGIDRMPVVIFVTAYDEYAIEAFDVQAVDYLLKPYDSDRFKTSFGRALERIRSKQHHALMLKQLLEEIRTERKYLDRIMVNTGSRYFFVSTRDIMYISADEKYLELHTENETYLIRETVNNIEGCLDPAQFVRIHRSHIVNIDYIKEMQSWSHGDYVVILTDDTRLNLSRRFRDRVFGRI